MSVRALVVCLGNICRSPIGEELLRHHAHRAGLSLYVDSAGTSGWHQGEPPDSRSVQIMSLHGFDISKQKSRALNREDLQLFDFILVMDRQNLKDVKSLGVGRAKVSLFIENSDVPDPYYGGNNGFQLVYEMLDQAAAEWINSWSNLHD